MASALRFIASRRCATGPCVNISGVRTFAKKSKGRGKKKSKGAAIQNIGDEEAAELVDIPRFQTQIGAIREHLVDQYKGLRAGKPSPSKTVFTLTCGEHRLSSAQVCWIT